MAKSNLKRISANLPSELVEEATSITEANITDTLILGLQLVKRSLAYKKAMNLKGKIKIDVDLEKSRER